MGLETVAMGAMIAGTAMSAFSSVRAGQQQKKWYDYNASVARQNATFEADSLERKGEALKGQQRVMFGRAGVTPEGTPTAVMADTAGNLARDVAAIRYKGARLGDIQEMQGENAEEAGYWGAGTTVLTGLGSMFGPKVYKGYWGTQAAKGAQ